jgi:hypothetical protein
MSAESTRWSWLIPRMRAVWAAGMRADELSRSRYSFPIALKAIECAGERPVQDEPDDLAAQSLAAQLGDEQAYRVGHAVLVAVHLEPGAAH